ncbi:MAG: methylenetetrahydrofolate reductase [Chloroflexota bacterium]
MQYASQFNVKILAGVIVLASARMARYMNDNVPGIIVPQAVVDELTAVEKGKGLQKGIDIAARFIRAAREENLCHGVHVMAVGNEKVVPDILAAAQVVVHH